MPVHEQWRKYFCHMVESPCYMKLGCRVERGNNARLYQGCEVYEPIALLCVLFHSVNEPLTE